MTDRDLPEGGTWDEWRRLVLSEQRRFGHDMRELTKDVRTLAGAAAMASEVKELTTTLAAAEGRLEALEERVDTYRKTIGAVSLTLLASILLPILRAWGQSKGTP